MDKDVLLEQIKAHILANRLEQAETLCEQVLRDCPDDVPALFSLGSIYLLTKRYEPASELMKKVIELDPKNTEALNNLGVIELEFRRNTLNANMMFKRVLELDPTHKRAMLNLGNVYLNLDQMDAAKQWYEKILAVDPDNTDALNNLSVVYINTNRHLEGLPYLQRAVELTPGADIMFFNLAAVTYLLHDKRKMREIIAKVEAMEDPGIMAVPLYSFAKKMCLWDHVSRYRQRALGVLLDPGSFKSPSLYEMVGMDMIGDDGIDNKSLFAVHCHAGDETRAIHGVIPPFKEYGPALASLSGKLRVGYLSADFRSHVSNHFIRGLVNDYDRHRFEIFCYSNLRAEDEDGTSQEYRQTVDAFINVIGMTDSELAQRIHDDGIHILVDFGGYTIRSRFAVMCYQPAPVQITYLGYPYTTGLPEVDYVISDPYLDGPENARYYAEQPLRLPESFITFDTLNDHGIDPRIPLSRNGYVTFGSLSNPYKLNPTAVMLWSRVLNGVENARLLLNHPLYDFEETRLSIWQEFAKHGIAANRVEMVWQKHAVNHLRYYNDIDVALDTMPMTGGTTTVEALWMGVPVVTLVGEAHANRLSYSIIKNVGIPMDDLIAFDQEEYVAKAIRLGSNPERIAELHRNIPAALWQSILCDPVRLTRQMESLYIEAWNKKWPQHPISIEVRDFPLEYVPVRGGEVAVLGSLNELNTYVLREQQGWFDAEYDFVLDLAQPGMRVVDIGAGVGDYAIPLARRASAGGVWATTRTPMDARYLSKGKERNGLSNIEIMMPGDGNVRLDVLAAQHALTSIDFVRLNINATAVGVIEGGVDFFSKNSPLVLVAVKRDFKFIDTSLVDRLKSMGYGAYQLVPGLGVLIPFTSVSDFDAFALNLFCCRPDRAELLAQSGKLVREIAPLGDFPGIQVQSWLDYLGQFPYLTVRQKSWLTLPNKQADWEVYWVALNLYAWAKDAARTPQDRYACLTGAYNMLVMLAQSKPTVERLFSLCRVLTELGKREIAVNVLNQICVMLAETDLDFGEPLLALSEEAEQMSPGEKMREWALSTALEQREMLREFSSYFSARDSRQLLEIAQQQGFGSEKGKRRMDLIDARFGG